MGKVTIPHPLTREPPLHKGASLGSRYFIFVQSFFGSFFAKKEQSPR